MFKLHRHNKVARSGERIDFKLSQFQVLQVPKGWDKLFVSIISVETGKTVAKSSKGLVRNGTCQWKETLSEPIWVSQDGTSKEYEECLFKFVVAMGSARSGILGEATVNMASYMKTSASVPVSLPLKKCNYGTILQIKIHCQTPRTKLGDNESKEANSEMEDMSAEDHDIDNKSYGSDNTFSRSAESSSSKELASTAHPQELGSRETSFSASGSHNSLDSGEGSEGREIFFPRNNLREDSYNQVGVQGQGSTTSQNHALNGNYSVRDPSLSNHSSFTSRATGSRNSSQKYNKKFVENSSPVAVSSLRNAGASKDLLIAAEDTIEELRAEAKMWERNARKLTLDLDLLRNEFLDHSKTQATLEMELSAACSERDGLKNEVQKLKLTMEESIVKQTQAIELRYHSEGVSHLQRELEYEIKFQKESNADLALQLKRSQEANVELVTVLQELEEIIEKQKIEIENVSLINSKSRDVENTIDGNLGENRISEKNLQDSIQVLETALEVKNNEIEDERTLNNKRLLDIEENYKIMLCAKEKEIVSLEAKLSEILKAKHPEDRDVNEGDANLIGEIRALKGKVQELEKDCDELTNENLDLILKLKESGEGHDDNSITGAQSCQSEFFSELTKSLQMAFSHVNRPWYNIPSVVIGCDYSFDNIVNSKSTDEILKLLVELNRLLEERIIVCEKVLKNSEAEIRQREEIVAETQKKLEDKLEEKNLYTSLQEHESKNDLEAKLSDIGNKLAEKTSEEKEIEILRNHQRELEAHISDLRNEKIQQQETMETIIRERNITSRCLDDLRNDLKQLSSSIDFHVSANQILERKSLELENAKDELELCLSELEEQNLQLSERISGLEGQLRYVTDEKESTRLKLENSMSDAMSLEDEIAQLRIELEVQNSYHKEKVQDMQTQLSEVQDECEYLRSGKPELQDIIDGLIEECNYLKKSNGELVKQKLELHERSMYLEAELRRTHRCFLDCSNKVEGLEGKLSSMWEEIDLKEKSLTSQLDELLDESRKQKEKLVLEESLLSQMFLDKTVEVENLQSEVEQLKKQISATQDEMERIASETSNEVLTLRSEKAKLESSHQEIEYKLKATKKELQSLSTEFEMPVKNLMKEITSYKQNEEVMMANNEKMSNLLDTLKSNDEKYKTRVNDLELKLTVSEYARQQLTEETDGMKVQLQKIANLQNEVFALRSEIEASNFEKRKLEASLYLISQDFEELKVEKTSLTEKISSLQKAEEELEECKRGRVALEERVLLMEGDLTAKGALCAQEGELRNELNRNKRENKQLQRKIQQIEEEKDKLMKRNQELDEGFKRMKQNLKLSKNEIVKSTNQNRVNRRKPNPKISQVQEPPKTEKESDSNRLAREFEQGDKEERCEGENPCTAGADSVSRIQLLETELAEALQENNKNKFQLQRLMFEEQHAQAETPRKSSGEGEVVPKERFERTKSSLESELRDLQDRYFHMSLKYAEVEAQREELVMKLKSGNTGKKWFG